MEVITSASRIPPDSSWLKFVNPPTARLLRSVLAIENLRKAADEGKKLLHQVLCERGIMALEDVQSLYPDRITQLLETTGAANLEDLYSAIGSGAVRLGDIAKIFDEVGMSNTDLNWTTININSGSYANKPGVLAKLAGLISDSGGNIVRSVNNTMPDGGFNLRLVVQNMTLENEIFSVRASTITGINIKEIEMVP